MSKRLDVEMWRGEMRIPKPMMDWVKERAKCNFRTANAELVEIVREAMKREQASHGVKEA